MVETPPVGLVGIGLMGEAFAHRLIGAGLGSAAGALVLVLSRRALHRVR